MADLMPADVAALRQKHTRTPINACDECDYNFPCPTVLLCDSLEAAWKRATEVETSLKSQIAALFSVADACFRIRNWAATEARMHCGTTRVVDIPAALAGSGSMLQAVQQALPDLPGDFMEEVEGIATAHDACIAVRARREAVEECAKIADAGILDIGCTALEAAGIVRRTRDAIVAALRAQLPSHDGPPGKELR